MSTHRGSGSRRKASKLFSPACRQATCGLGARFTLDRAQALHAALRDAAQTIDRMPSTFMTYPMGGRILPVERGRLRGPPSIVELDTDYLTAFGWMRVPGHLWR